MPQMDIELMLELSTFFFFILIFVLGQQIILTINRTSVLIKLRNFYLFFYTKQTSNFFEEIFFVQKHNTKVLLK